MSNFSFGAPATTTATAPTFNFNTQTASTGLSGTTGFGVPAQQPNSAPANQPTLNFSFGSSVTPNTTAQAQPSLQFNTATTSAGLNLFSGIGTATQPTTTSSNLSFATPNKPASAPLNFGTPATTATLSFNTPATTGVLSFGNTNTTITPGINFSTPATTGTAPINFGAPTTSTSSFGLPASTTGLLGSTSGSLFGAKSATVTTTTNVITSNRGLGGLDISLSSKGLSQGSNSPTVAKENLLPNELMQTIDSFKEFVKSQKSLSSDIARGSARPLNRCSEDTASLMEILTTLAGNVQRDRLLADKLKQDTAKSLQNAEIAQRTHDIPPGLQYENNAPLLFFLELGDHFENDLMLFKNQIEVTEKHLQTMMTPKAITPQELTTAMSKLHESLVAAAGKLQGVHSKVQQQKEQYLNFRKYVLKDSTNVFDDVKTTSKLNRSNSGNISLGPTPFSQGNRSFLNSSLSSNQTQNYGSHNPLVWGNSAPTATTNLLSSSMKPPSTGLSFNPPLNLTAPLTSSDTSSSFQLQKPPISNKRGKH